MNINCKYDISDKIDKSLVIAAAECKEISNDRYIIDELLEKHIVEYNKILNKSCSSRSLKVMNQNSKQIFSTFTPEVIKSPRRSSDSAGKDEKAPYVVDHQFRTPTKSNLISSKTERKRLSFDVTEIEHMNPVKAFTEDSSEDQMHLNRSASFFKHDDEAEYSDNPIEKFNPDGISESVTSLHDMSTETPIKNETLLFSHEQKIRERINVIVKGWKPWYLQCRSSHYTYKLDNTNVLIRERFNPEGKPETFTSLDDYDNDDMVISIEETTSTPTNYAILPTKCDDNHRIVVTIPEEKNSTPGSYFNMPTKYSDNHQMMVTASEENNSTLRNHTNLPTECVDHQIVVTIPEKKNITPANYADNGRKSTRGLEISPSISTSMEEKEISEEHNKNEESFQINEKVKTVSSMPITPLKTLCISSNTPKKTEASPLKANKKIRKSINQNAAKRVMVKITNSDDKENISPTKEIKTPNTPKIKKRKFVDNSEKAIMSTCLVTSDQEFVVPSKISKIIDLTINNENVTISTDVCVISGNDSIGSTEESLMNANNSFSSIDNSAMDDNDSINLTDDGFVNDKDVIQSDDKSTMFAIHIYNNKTPERPTYEQTVGNDSVSLFTQELNQKKIVAEVKSDSKNPKYGKHEVDASETKIVESLTDCMKDLNPSMKHSDVSPLHKSMTNRLRNDCATMVRKFPLQENLSANIISGSKCLKPNESYTKQDNMYALEAKKLTKLLKQRKSRFSMYLHIFVDDKDNLNFICDYVKTLASCIDKIPVDENNEAALNAVDNFAGKGSEIRHKAKLWILDIKEDLEVWENCIQQIYHIEQDVKRVFRENKQVTFSKYFQEWEKSYKIVNKTADDMILRREIRRPTVIQFGYEVQYLFQLFIQCALLLGILKHSAKDTSDKM